MSNFDVIISKLEQFIKKFYLNELLKGIILFFSIGLLYFLFTLFLEYILWLSTTARAILFWIFITAEIALFTRFIVVPLAKLFKLKKGIDYESASVIIGKHFPQVNDKLLNVLQLKGNNQQSDLLLASIEQKSLELKPIPFKMAINLKHNTRYLKYAAIPLIIIILSLITGHFNLFSDSYNRVVNYNTAYEPPAPFQFYVVNENLNALENEDFKLFVRTAGNILPENAQISFNKETYYLKNTGPGYFEYTFSKAKEPITFNFIANSVSSRPYTLNIIEVPALLGFEIVLDYPAHTNITDETLKSTGNTIVPEGTKVTWNLKTKATDNVLMFSKDTMSFNALQTDNFELSKQLFNDFHYALSTSNKNLKDYENLSFTINVVKDEYPRLDIKSQIDSTDMQTLYFYGQANDDYGLSRLQLVYYPTENVKDKKVREMSINSGNVTQFVSTFPDKLNIEDGLTYELYFQVFDNDRINNYKSSKSNVFIFKKRTGDEEAQRRLEEQSEAIKDLNKSLERYDEQEKQLEEITRSQKEKTDLNFNDKKKLESFLKRQAQQDEMMKHFNNKLKENLEEFQKENPEKEEFKEDIKERIEENEEQLKKDEKLLEELKELQEKISQEELVEKLEELAKQNKNRKRSLEQLLELTKRFYMEKKLEKLKDDLMKQAIEQEKLSNEDGENNSPEKQEELNKNFEEFKKELENLEKNNKDLKKPMDIPRDKLDENEVQKNQKQAKEQLEKNDQQKSSGNDQQQNEQNQNLNNAQKNQKKAAQKMKEMSQNMQSSMQASGAQQTEEDIEALRQILDNLILFSFDEESLMETFRGIDLNNNKYASFLRKQNTLKEHFEHIDDSLFALSLRQPKISERVNKEITEVYFNIDKALELLAENNINQGASRQQFAVTAANNLADFLSDILDNMQESMSMSPGQGGQGDMQLPDIIMSQEELNKMMEEGLKDGDKGEKSGVEPKKPGQGDQEKSGEGKDGKSGNNDNKSGGKGEPESEEFLNGKLFEIYQQQQELRNALEKRLEKEGLGSEGDRILKQMENIEMDLLNKGFTNRTLQKMLQLQHQLLKLDNAAFQQGEENKRESKTNQNNFNNQTNNRIIDAKEYFNTIEILNRQALPLQQTYKRKVKEYFDNSND